ncbi:cupredoxin domain-containing protein [Nocardia sp. NBC_01329]|uniref:cupredoxin domain-containing protein n=1 Tax=Nocardia sp. NBC_01329 TaxID=2903594 RepID=UPI002E0E0128|nr:cupredoxin domain-containing protein [Nocardia sp. NBC_01329]
MPRAHRAVVVPVAGFALVAALLSGCDSGGSAEGPAKSETSGVHSQREPEATVTVEVEEDRFSPTDITIAAGDTVSWHFDGDLPHGVQGIGDKAMGINSPLFEVGDWSHTFTQPGEYRYLCPIHPDMRGTITVEE